MLGSDAKRDRNKGVNPKAAWRIKKRCVVMSFKGYFLNKPLSEEEFEKQYFRKNRAAINMEKARNDELYRALKEKDYPDDFCREIAYNQIRTDYTATRMLGYLYRTSNPRAEDVVDEMLAIFSDRDAVMQKKELEHAQATINQITETDYKERRT